MRKMMIFLGIASFLLVVSNGEPHSELLVSVNPLDLNPEWEESFLIYLPLATKNFAGDFDEQFIDSAIGWISHPEGWEWEILEDDYYSSAGIQDAWVSTSYTTSYNNFDFEAALKRSGCSGCPYGLIVRGQPYPMGNGYRWDSGYGFYITQSGYYGIFKYSNGIVTALQEWDTSENISGGEDDWNILRIRADNEEFEFYINDIDTPVWLGSDSEFASGKVGILMYSKPDSTGDRLWVDWAKLSSTQMTVNH